MEKVKRQVVTAGKFVTFWKDDSILNIYQNFGQVNAVRYSDTMDMMFLGCSDGELCVIDMKGIRV
jgi:hypothetical protein